MKKNRLIVSCFSLILILTSKPTNINLDDIALGSSIASSSVNIIKHTYNTGKFVAETIHPPKEEKLKQEFLLLKLRILSAEEQLNKCLVDYSLHPEIKEIFNVKCKHETDELALSAGYLGVIAKKDEFIKALHNLENDNTLKKLTPNSSNSISPKRILITGTYIVVGGTLACAVTALTVNPLVGYAIASSTFSAATPVVVGCSAGTAMTTGGIVGGVSASGGFILTGITMAGNAIASAKVGATIIAAGKTINTASFVMGIGSWMRPYVYRNYEEELEYQLKLRKERASLEQRIKEKYFQQNI